MEHPNGGRVVRRRGRGEANGSAGFGSRHSLGSGDVRKRYRGKRKGIISGIASGDQGDASKGEKGGGSEKRAKGVSQDLPIGWLDADPISRRSLAAVVGWSASQLTVGSGRGAVHEAT